MILKKFYGATINEAMRDAKDQLGDDVVLLESVPPEGKRPAAITVMVDDKLDTVADEPDDLDKEQDEGFRNVFYKRSDVRKPMAKTTPEVASEEEIEEEPEAKTTRKSRKKDVPEFPEVEEADPLEAPMSRRRKSLINIPDLDEEDIREQAEKTYHTDSVSREVTALHRRFDQLQAMLSDSVVSANLDYVSHPSFQQLLDSGLRATTVSQWFKQVLDKGIDPFDDNESFMFELSRIIRDVLTIAMPPAAQKNMIFAGPSGSGKTTLIMKLVTSEDFMGDSDVALVSVEPRGNSKTYTILEPFAKDHDLPFFKVRDGIDVSKLMPKLEDFDYVLFDTPSISLEKKSAFREYWKIRQILASVLPVEIHFVINATMENYYFREAYATNHPLQPDYVAITHLDETRRWGHLIPFLKTLGCSVRYMSMGQNTPDDVSAFSPAWFAEKILSPVS